MASTDAKAGINIIVYFINCFYCSVKSWRFCFEYADEELIKNITIPAENLSKREYIPKTNAPVFAFVPTTSDMKFIPVESTIVCETPTKMAMMYITQLLFSVKNNIEPRHTTQIPVPTLKAVFLPNLS